MGQRLRLKSRTLPAGACDGQDHVLPTQASGKKAGLAGTQVSRVLEQRSLTCWEPCCELVRREDAPPEAAAAHKHTNAVAYQCL